MRMDGAIGKLRWAQQRLKDAHFEACSALAKFDAMDADKSLPVETRIAARLLKQETLGYCERMLRALETVPTVALPEVGRQKTEDRGPKVELPCIKTAAWMLNQRRNRKTEGVVATSARHGRPILVAMSILLIALFPMVGKADTCHLTPATSRSIERVIDALIVIESSGRPAVIGDGGAAVGCLQIHPVAVREANRIAGSNHWKLADRFCPAKSRAMARTTLVWHFRRGVTDPVELACKWNRPFGEVSAEYRARVRSALARGQGSEVRDQI